MSLKGARLGNLASGYNGVVLEIAMEMEVCYTGSRKFTLSFLSEDLRIYYAHRNT